MTSAGTRIDAFAPAHQLLQSLNSGQVSSVELTELYLERIARLDGKVNAIAVKNADAARATARAADARRKSGEKGALLGLPTTLKESTHVAGMPATAGVEAFKGYSPEDDSLVASRMKSAGTVLLGKTNIPPFLADWQSDNPLYGRTVNPWDKTRTPGGSTGGGAAALAAGLTPLEIGSDIGGSIRVPASFCGVYGHRPSETVVPRYGGFPMSTLPNVTSVMGVQGPLARSARDLELALAVIAGPEVGEDVAWRLEIPPSRHERLSDFRIAVLPAIDWCPVDGQVLAAQEKVIEAAARAGARVERAQPDGFQAETHHNDYYRVLQARMNARQPREVIEGMLRAVEGSESPLDQSLRQALTASAADYFQWMDRREQYRESYRRFFREWDILLCPITIVPAFEHTSLPWPERFVTVDGAQVPYGNQLVYPGIATLSGQPATAFPVSRSSDGLPIGLQAIGPYLEDRTSIRFAELLEREIGGFVAPPGFE